VSQREKKNKRGKEMMGTIKGGHRDKTNETKSYLPPKVCGAHTARYCEPNRAMAVRDSEHQQKTKKKNKEHQYSWRDK